MLRVCRIAAVAAVATVTAGRAAALDCSATVAKGATYDLSALSNVLSTTGGDLDCTAQTEESYTYTFNVCGTASAPLSACAKQDGVAVWQSNEKFCYPAGQNDQRSALALVDSGDRSKGVSMTFSTTTDAARCHTNNVQRKTTLRIFCDETATEPRVEQATEPAGSKSCAYQVDVKSVHGCPTECKRGSDGKVCSGNGYCLTDSGRDADGQAATAKCFCNNGYEGDSCEQGGPANHNQVPSNTGAIIALLVVLFLLMIGLGVVVFLLVRQIKGYRDDTANYMAIRDNGDDSM